MKAKKKEKLFFVKELPDDYEIDLDKARTISNEEFERLMKESQPKTKRVKKS